MWYTHKYLKTTTTVVVVVKTEACACEDGKTEVEIMSEETKETTVKSEAENIVEREFASLRTQLEEACLHLRKEIESEFKSSYERIRSLSRKQKKKD